MSTPTDPYDEYARRKQWEAEGFGKPDRGEQAFFPIHMGRHLHVGATILEIGFGNGAFLGWAQEQGHTIWGLEVQDVLNQRARAMGVKTIQSLAEIDEGILDMVVALDVFEHILFDDLLKLCHEICRRLKTGGTLVARFPNADSPFGLAVQHADSTHVTHLGHGVVDDLMRRSGFDYYTLSAPAEPALSGIQFIKKAIKNIPRAAFVVVAKSYQGPAAPPSYTMNYMLTAFKRSH
jgi:SAM-dependent methyltransferase